MPDSAATGATPIASSRPSPHGWRRVLGWLRATAKWLTIIYAAVLFVLLPALEWWGERNWLLSLLLYAPASLLLMPLLILTPFCLIFRARWILLHLICAAVVCLVYMTHRWSAQPPRNANTLTVITHNTGQGNRAQFDAFVRGHSPDVIVLQDIRGDSAQYSDLLPGMQMADRGEFCVLSRHPIRTAELVANPTWRGRPLAARFEISANGRTFALYNVHLPTPRSQFSRFLSKRVVADFFGDEDHAGGFASYREWINARRKLALDLASVFAAEKLPYLACGDFNTPDHGFIYHVFAGRMTDAHASAGNGFGMTFPCDVKPAATSLGPWLRIDYAFAGRGWQPAYCETEVGTRSQHRAVLAHFLPKPPP
jgi:endonuclease/exonuclease/phosphatase family metal-dependent hydrolase